MYLKSIEIQGFKSFANRIVFEFHNGITGIVGPNGSGKSNVADAVRWVLGEQRIKQLRGASMQDVIFAGTELKKPQGFAYVAITLSNEDHQLAIDFDEVTVSRRLYRSGESEYKINGSACRLKDINELFYDTGIGKEGYSIIGQGQIDRILSGKPEERRELFDEAAGIVKFKRRKALAQKKLEDEQANLIRVNDILAELEKQIGPLERQAEAAKKYLAIKEELKTCDIGLFLLESGQLNEQLKEIQKRSDIVSADMDETREQAGQQKAACTELEEKLAGLEDSISENKNLAGQADLLKGNLEGQINVLNEQIRTEELRAEHIRERRAATEKEIAQKREQIRTYRGDNSDVTEAAAESRRKTMAAEYALAQEDSEIQELERRLEEAKAGIISSLNEKAELSAREQRCAAMQEQMQVRRAEVLQKLLKVKSDESAQEEELSAGRKKLEEAGRRLQELEKARENAAARAEELETARRRLTQTVNAKHQDYQTARARLESLQNLAERYEGYGNSTRRVMELKKREPGIEGVVADLIATEQRFETAIETALGGSIQNVVTDNEQTAKRLIEYLKKNRFGRQTFLPLTGMGNSSAFSKPEALREPGVIGLASGLVKTQARYQALVRQLLGRVIVADTIDHAIALAKKYRYSLRIVTLEGELFSAGGSMTGGAFKNSSNLLGRRRELEELEKQCEKAKKEEDVLSAELMNTEREFADVQVQQERVRNDLHAVSLEQNTLQLSVGQMQEKKDSTREASGDLTLENAQLEEQLAEIEKNRQSIREDEGSLKERSGEETRLAEELSARLEQARKKRSESAQNLEAIKIEAANLKQKVDFLMENIRRVEEETGRLTEELSGLSSGSGETEQAISQKRGEITRLQERIADTEREKQELAQKLETLSGEREETLHLQKQTYSERERLTDRLNQLDRDLFRLQNQKEKLEERLESRVNYMWSEYELTLSAARESGALEDVPAGELKTRIEELKAAIRKLGNVNVNAIEDYKEVHERYSFLKTQHDDLTEAEASLLKIIGELDEGMRRQFAEKFQDIRREFDRVFKELFGGGHGTLELLEDEDILEAGIQIIAQPPGKKLQNMMQLSGGEKALTAIALLFAIQNLKPSPFCLLDEIEAALDDSNVDRFAGYLHKLTKNTQFIVITHRRGTMVAADRLYGITMQEKGVSALVSVSLIEDQLDQ